MGELVAGLAPGPLWRLDRGNTVTVRLYGGALESVPEVTMLNGANVAAIGSPETGFEVIQFRLATMFDATTWTLSDLLRGQGGTADVMAAGHAAGARFVLLTPAVTPVAISEAEAGLGLVARCGPADAIYDPDDFVDVALPVARRGRLCLAPVQLRARRDPESGDATITWIRQTRIGGDAWEPSDVPLGEEGEAYQVEILDGGAVVRRTTTTWPMFVYSAGQQVDDLGDIPASLSVRICQLSATLGPGIPATRTLSI